MPGSSDEDSGFDDESDADGSDDDKKRPDGASEVAPPKENKLQIELYRTGVITCHSKKVKKVCMHYARLLIYSISDDKRLCVSSIEMQSSLFHIKCSSMHPKTMALHQDNSRLFVSMKEAVIFVFDVTEVTPIVIHTITDVQISSQLQIDR